MKPAGKRYITHPSRSDVISIWNLADIHLGSSSCAKEHVIADIKKIKDDPYSFWLGGGDYADYISPKDKRWSSSGIDADLIKVKDLGELGKVMTDKVGALFEPIKHKCLGLALGNHEAKYQTINEQEMLHGYLCTNLGVPSLDYSAILDLVFQRCGSKSPRLHLTVPQGLGACSSFRVCIHHGFGSSNTPGGKLNTLIKLMTNVEADIYFMGHVHDQKGQRQIRIAANAECNKLVARESIGVITGSYLKTYSDKCTSYGEVKGYAPTPLGAARVTIKPETRELKGEV